MPASDRCPTTHRQIIAGDCPWCAELIGAMEPALATSQGSSERAWDLVILEDDLRNGTEQVRLHASRNLGVHPRGVSVPCAVRLLRVALVDANEKIREDATFGLALMGARLGPQEIERYEEESTRAPDDLAVRILLLGGLSPARRLSDTSCRARRAHILWIMAHAPRSPIAGTPYASLRPTGDGEAYDRAKGLWFRHIDEHPRDTSILLNAASFLTCHDRAKAAELLRRGKSLEPDNPTWSAHLGHLYELEGIGKEAACRNDWAKMAQAEYERELALIPDERERIRRLPRLAETAFEAGDHKQAHTYATKLLTKAGIGHRGEAIYHGNHVLGRVALARGDVDSAKSHLLESAKAIGSPVLCSFGPRMGLARDLLARGERATVLRYLELCSAFWERGADELARYASEIEAGKLPRFRR